MKRIVVSKWSYRLVRWALALIFIYAGASKLQSPKSFALIIHAYGLAPLSWVDFISVSLPILEIVAAIGLFFDIRGSLAIVTILLLFFMAVLSYGIYMGFDINCGCFKYDATTGKVKGWLRLALFRDFIMMLGILFLCTCRRLRVETPVSFRSFVAKGRM